VRAKFPFIPGREPPGIFAKVGPGVKHFREGDEVEKAVRLCNELERMITHRFPAARFADAFVLLRQRESNAMKVTLEWRP
jgi:threonine dehydrogenase-like Zn-dependent dehydrogenase